ncbi:major facilitator superfamily domain-containing protein [Gorgonomyces haynaldii]|nr:major facilitator superfamily domain-containing protein [Gorgonomyces haynaldii]
MTYSICTPVMPFVFQNPTEISLLVSSYGVGLLAMSPVIGIISDWSGKRKLLIMVGTLVLALSSLLFAIFQVYYVLLVCRILQGGASATVWTLGLAMVAERYDQNLGTAMGIVFACCTFGQLVAPAVAGMLYDLFGYPAPFLLITGLSCLALVLQLPLEEKKGVQRASSFKSFFDLFRNGPLLLIMTMLCFGGMVLAYIDVFLPLHLANAFQYEPTRVGLIMLGFALPQILFGAPAGYLYDKIGFKSVLVGLLFTICGGTGATFSQEIIGLLSSMFIMSIGIAFTSTPFMAEISHCAPKAQFAQSYGLLNLSLSIGMFLGPLVGSPIYIHFGWQGIAIAMAAMGLLSVPLAVIYRAPHHETPVIVQVA